MDILLLGLRLLLVILLYAFLGTISVILWRDLKRASQSRHKAPTGRLVVVKAEGEGLSEGAVFPLQPITSLGRSPNNTIVIPDTYTSAQHALLSWREGQWWLRDCQSRNGTLLNGACLEESVIVSGGDVIGIGRTQFRLEVSDGS
jgi:hypothetical protein